MERVSAWVVYMGGWLTDYVITDITNYVINTVQETKPSHTHKLPSQYVKLS